MKEDDHVERLCFIRKGKEGLDIEIIGSSAVLMNMIQSAMISHAEVRKILFPVMMMLMKDERFLDATIEDIMLEITGQDNDDVIDTE